MSKTQLKKRVLTLISKIQELQEKCAESGLDTPHGDEQFKQQLLNFYSTL